MARLRREDREAVERANKLIEERGKQLSEGTPPEEAQPPQEPVAPIEPQPVVEPEQQAPGVIEPVAQAEPQPQEPAQPIEEMVPKSLLDEAEHRYQVMDGKYRAEVPISKALTERVEYLSQQVQELAQREIKPVDSKPIDVATPKSVTDDPKVKAFAKEYDEIYEATVIVCRGMIQEAIGSVQSQINQKFEVEHKEKIQTKQSAFYGDLDKVYSGKDGKPDWREIQKSADFSVFMQEEDALSGLPRYALWKNALEQWDSRRILKFFDVFLGVNGKPSTTSTPATINPSKVASRIAPARASSAAPSTTVSQPVMSKEKAGARLEEMARQKANRRYPGSDIDYKKEEARLRGILLSG